MEDKIFIKTRKDGIWEKNATLGFALYMAIFLVILFGSTNLVFIGVPWEIIDIIQIVSLILIVPICILTNQSQNISKSTGFIKRDGKLYAIQLFYTRKKLGTETDNHMIYGSAEQIASISNNLKVANDVQAHEKEVRERRKNPISFSIALDDILEYIGKNPQKYDPIPDVKRSKIDKIFKVNIQNAGLYTLITKNAQYGFLILNNPKIIKETKRYFIISFESEKKEACTVKFSNCFDGIIDEIKNSI